MRGNHDRVHPSRIQRIGQDRGAIIIFVALGLVVLIGMAGLAIDLGHAYVNKSQLQNVADASALAGASALNGTAAGIIEAEARATDAGSLKLLNKTEFNKTTVAIDPGYVRYLTSLNGTPMTRGVAESNAAAVRFVRVEIPADAQPTTVFLAKVVPGIPSVMNFGAVAVAGQEPLTEVCQGLDPFSPARLDSPSLEHPVCPCPDPTGNFGYVKGEVYTMRLSPGSKEANCSVYGLPGGVTGNYGIADPAGLGPNPPDFERTLLGIGYSRCTPIGDNALPTNPGVMAVPILKSMNLRFEQDSNQTEYFTNPYASYLSDYLPSPSKPDYRPNYRRIIRVAFNDLDIPGGHSGYYNVDGFGCFFMPVKLDKNLTSDAVCLIYVGACDESGEPTGGNTPSITKVVLFR